MKKRFFALLLAAVMLLNAFPAYALESNHSHTHIHNHTDPTFVVETVDASAGEMVDVTICLVNNPGITSLKLEVEYDRTVLTLQSVTPNSELGSNFLTSPASRYPLILNWYDGLNDISGDWTFATLHFAVAENAADGTYPVTISYDPNDVYDANEDNVHFDIEDGGIVVSAEPEEDPDQAVFQVDTVTAYPGETVDVAIRLRNNPGITSIKLSVEHPDGVDGITLVSVTPNPDLGSNFLTSPAGRYPLILNWYDGLNDVTGDWVFATLRFSIPAGITAFTYPINVTFNPDDIYNADENNVAFTVENGAIVVENRGECNHSYLPVVTAPTCTEGGYTTYTCSLCGDSYVADETAPLGHDLGDWFTVTEAACEAEGLERRACSRCDYAEENVLPALDHDYEAVVTEPTCVDGGYTTHTCTRCGHSYVDSHTEALGHAWDEGIVVKEPTEEETGIRRHTCTRCGATEDRTIPTIDHVHDYEAVVTEPTCTEGGYTTYTCRCGDSYVAEETAPLGHDLSEEWTLISAATCTADGLERRFCSRCQHVEEQVLPALGHDFQGDTCARCGYTEGGFLVHLSLEEAGEGIGSVWVDGVEYPVIREGDGYTVTLPNAEATNLVIYSMVCKDPNDIHTWYSEGMKVWMLKYEEDAYTATYIPEFDNLLEYEGCAIRIVGVKGIRMITSIQKNVRSALTGKGLAGYTLVEYGNAVAWADEINPALGLTLGQGYTKSNYAYKKGVEDAVYKREGSKIQYTNVLTFTDNEKCKPDLGMRPYIILQDAEGNQVTIYGGVVYRNIGYVAVQCKDEFKPNSAAYDYVWDIIHYVYGDQYDESYKG